MAANIGHGVDQGLAQAGAHAAGEQAQIELVDDALEIAAAGQLGQRVIARAHVDARAGPAQAGAAHVQRQIGPGRGRGLADQLELRQRAVLRTHRRAGRHMARTEVAEDRGRHHHPLSGGIHLGIDAELAGLRTRLEGAHPLRHPQHRFAQLVAGAGRRQAACLRVEQDGAHHRAQIAAHAPAVVGEDRGDAAHIGRAGVAAHQALDQLPADEGADVRMVEQGVERDLQVAGGAAAGRDAALPGLAGEQALLQQRVLSRIGLHALQVDAPVAVSAVVGPAGAQLCLGQLAVREGPAVAGEDPCQRHHVGIAVGLDRSSAGVGHHAAVRSQLMQADGEELHQLAGEVLVGQAAAGGVFLLVAHVRQVQAHRRRQRDLLDQVAEIAEGLAVQQVEIAGVGACMQPQAVVMLRDHEDLVQREGGARAQLVRRLAGMAPEMVSDLVRVVLRAARPVFRTEVVAGLDRADEVGRGRQGQLPVDPGGQSGDGELLDLAGQGAEAGLQQQPGGLLALQARGGGQRGQAFGPGDAQCAIPGQIAAAGRHLPAVEGQRAGAAVIDRLQRAGLEAGVALADRGDEEIAVLAAGRCVVVEDDLQRRAAGEQGRHGEGMVAPVGVVDRDGAERLAVQAHRHARADPAHQRAAYPQHQLRRARQQRDALRDQVRGGGQRGDLLCSPAGGRAPQQQGADQQRKRGFHGPRC